jgi:choline dehydrogenase-like flavoprotein
MGFCDASDLPQGARLETDICIVGAGAAGIALATALEGSPLRVALLESGGDGLESASDTLNELDIVGLPFHLDHEVRHRALGGTTTTWAGRCALLDPIDFAPRPWVAGSGWPLPASEIERFLPAAEDLLGLRRPEALHDEFWVGDPIFDALSSEDLSPRIHLFAGKPRLGHACRTTLRRSDTTTVYLHATAQELVAPADRNVVTHLEARSSSGRKFRLFASTWILACGALENPRLLLLSRKGRPAGLGNDHDRVGRYYMDHPRGDGIGRLFLDARHPLYQRLAMSLMPGRQTRIGARMQFAVGARPEFLQRNSLLSVSSFFYGASTERLARLRRSLDAVAFGVGIERPSSAFLAHSARLVAATPLLAKAAWSHLRRHPFAIDHLVLVDQVEQVPDPESRVTLSDRTDRFGQQIARLDWRIDDTVTRTLRAFHGALANHVRQAGLGRLESKLLDAPDFEPSYSECAHPMGTTRMHPDPRQGVVDTDCRVHGLDNLFTAGSSVFPTGGHAPPTLTLVALAIRLAQHLRQAHGSGRLGGLA